MISFYPGPSKVHPEVAKYTQQALKDGILSINHRSREFVEISKNTITLLKRKLNIPKEYSVFFTSSATECWEIIAQSLTKEKSFHIFSGAFGEKWHEYATRIKPNSTSYKFDYSKPLNLSEVRIPSDSEMLCLVQNETSNGTQISNKIIGEIRKAYPYKLIAIDATSSMAGVKLDFKNADIWFASVQKCFGLPAGMGLLICSPSAIKKAELLNENDHYNSLSFMIEKMRDWQTSYTPNVLGIYLLQEVMKKAESIGTVEKKIKDRHNTWYSFLKDFKEIKPLVENKNSRSYTVVAIMAEESVVKSIKEKAKKEGILLGNGYGSWAKNTFRIANFPAINDKEIKTLEKFLKRNVK